MGNFCLVHWYYHDQDTDTESSDNSAGVEIADALRTCLQSTAEAEDDSPN